MPLNHNYSDPDNRVVRAEVSLVGIEPAISRTLELLRATNLAELHGVLQAAFGWTDSHLHRFDIGGLDYGPPEHGSDDDDARRTFEASDVRLADLAFDYGIPTIIRYEYDLGDSWMHRLSMTLEPRDPDAPYPRCLAGSRSAPPEDAGGPHSYPELLDAWSDPGHPEHAAVRRWTGRRFDPERFDLAATNKAITSAVRRAKGSYAHRRSR